MDFILLPIVKSPSPYPNKKIIDFDEIWYTIVRLELDDSQITKYEFFFKFNGRRRFQNRF